MSMEHYKPAVENLEEEPESDTPEIGPEEIESAQEVIQEAVVEAGGSNELSKPGVLERIAQHPGARRALQVLVMVFGLGMAEGSFAQSIEKTPNKKNKTEHVDDRLSDFDLKSFVADLYNKGILQPEKGGASFGKLGQYNFMHRDINSDKAIDGGDYLKIDFTEESIKYTLRLSDESITGIAISDELRDGYESITREQAFSDERFTGNGFILGDPDKVYYIKFLSEQELEKIINKIDLGSNNEKSSSTSTEINLSGEQVKENKMEVDDLINRIKNNELSPEDFILSITGTKQVSEKIENNLKEIYNDAKHGSISPANRRVLELSMAKI